MSTPARTRLLPLFVLLMALLTASAAFAAAGRSAQDLADEPGCEVPETELLREGPVAPVDGGDDPVEGDDGCTGDGELPDEPVDEPGEGEEPTDGAEPTEETMGLDNAIEHVLANLLKNPDAPGLVNALGRLIENRERHETHEAAKVEAEEARDAAKAARAAAHGTEEHGNGHGDAHANGH